MLCYVRVTLDQGTAVDLEASPPRPSRMDLTTPSTHRLTVPANANKLELYGIINYILCYGLHLGLTT
ncbi:hypothetical protein E2C01_100099 [Portunus trituberculatus]|uniref:Uncharacterized protein n=1 Tax=Portunus trituberculatus TaxID=210409 RepID=A0A5B7K758_PORTR|nr:hypothetical protein [Portunus trituberculatus]